jgi:thiol-disulfide isomerase/thioredoxin
LEREVFVGRAMATYISSMQNAKTNRRTVLALAAGATLALGAKGSSVFAQASGFAGKMGPFRPHREPVRPPEIAFQDAEGRNLGLGDFRGRVAVVNYWATWCAPCVEEMPSLDRLQVQMGSAGVAVLAISVDRGGLRQVAPFFAANSLANLPVYLDPSGASMRAFAVRGLPTTIVIDPDGFERGRLEGAAAWDSPAAERMLRQYLSKNKI